MSVKYIWGNSAKSSFGTLHAIITEILVKIRHEQTVEIRSHYLWIVWNFIPNTYKYLNILQLIIFIKP